MDPVQYSFSDGFYQATSNLDSTWQVSGQFYGDRPEANALVLTGTVNGKETLSISFRGTDQQADFLDYTNFQSQYAKFAPLVAAIKTYLLSHPDVTQVSFPGTA